MVTATIKRAEPEVIASKFRAMAEAMQKAIDERRRPLMQNPTPKRLKEYSSRKLEGDNLERGQRALRALADAWERGLIPESLKHLRTKAEIVPMVRHGIESNSYYDVHSTGRYADQSPAAVALQALVDDMKGNDEKRRDAERERLAKIERMEHELLGCDIPGFFPTPRPLIDQMLAIADIEPTHKILEPSAGKGDIADALREAFPAAPLACCEIRPALREILEAKGHQVVASDFLDYEPDDCFDRIVMNPPFEQMQDVDHVRHAAELLAPGGRLVSIMSASPFFQARVKADEFREWLDAIDAEVGDVHVDAFRGADAFRQTGVRCKIVVINRPEE